MVIVELYQSVGRNIHEFVDVVNNVSWNIHYEIILTCLFSDSGASDGS